LLCTFIRLLDKPIINCMDHIVFRTTDGKIHKLQYDGDTRGIILSNRQIVELKIVGLEKLQSLDLSNNSIEKIEGIDRLNYLQEIDLEGNKIKKLKDTKYPISLQILWLGHNLIEQMDGIDYLTNLSCLNLNNNMIERIEGIDGLTALRELNLLGNKIRKIEVKNSPITLTYLNLESNMINSIKNIDGLHRLTGLQQLVLSYNLIEEIEGMDRLADLRSIHLADNKIKKINGLDSLIHLQTINLCHNQIEKIEGIHHLSELEDLFLFQNPIKYVPMSIMGLRNLKYLNTDKIFDPMIERFLTRNRIRTKQTIYDDRQNVHDSQINRQISGSLYRLMEEKLVVTNDMVIREIIDDPILTQRVKQQIVEYTKINDVHSVLNVTFMEALKYVWQIIRSHEHSDCIKKVFDQEMQDSICMCFTGRLSRLVNCLNGFDPRVIVRLSDQQEISNLIIAIKQKYSDIEQQIKMARIELTERGYDGRTIDEWIGYLE
jgi:hypothetical protein